MFHDEKLYTVSNFRKKLVEVKKAEPCAVAFMKRNFNFNVGKKHVVVEFQMYPETRLRVLQWKILHIIYPTNILLSKTKVRGNNKCSDCTDTVDSMEQFFAESPAVSKFWKFIEFILREFGIKVKLYSTDILF